MLIDAYAPDVEAALRRQYATLPAGTQLYLFMDGLFVPGICRQLAAENPVLLFMSLPGCSDEVKDVSPFVVRYDPANIALARALKRCSGWPMLSAITTGESVDRLAQRLAAWCVVEVDQQRFNFRFPDTRRLPAIFDALKEHQRAEMIGGALSWRYVGRDGTWQDLHWTPAGSDAPVATKAELDDAQFARLVSDSEPDEMWVRLQDRGVVCHLAPSRRHALLSAALELATKHGTDLPATVRWCTACVRTDGADTALLAERFNRWISDYENANNETLPPTP